MHIGKLETKVFPILKDSIYSFTTKINLLQLNANTGEKIDDFNATIIHFEKYGLVYKIENKISSSFLFGIVDKTQKRYSKF